MSACLLGKEVRYDGSDCRQDGMLKQWQNEGRIISFCPEVAGELPVPRPPAEIENGNAETVLQGKNNVRRKDGTDVTDAFLQGAEKALAECWKYRIKIAVLKEDSPSCGVRRVNNGTFSGIKIDGQGVTTLLLARHGISVFSEQQLDAASQRLRELER